MGSLQFELTSVPLGCPPVPTGGYQFITRSGPLELRIPDGVDLLDLAEPEFPALGEFRQALSGFFPYAVRMRYDGALYPSREETVAALETC